MLKVENLSKKYKEKLVLDKLSFTLKEGTCFGLLGTNGAGKTTAIRAILGILSKNEGKITWNNKKVERGNVNFGYLPEERGLYPKTKVIDQLIYFAELKGMKKEDARKEIKALAKKLKVDEYLEMNAEQLSKGNQQKVQILVAFQNNPELVILDEPFSGLDPVNTKIIEDFIVEKMKNTIIMLSAHQMSVVEHFCTDIVILDKGKTVLKGNLKEIKEEYKDSKLEIITLESIDQELKDANLEVLYKVGTTYTVKINSKEEAYKILDILQNKDKKLIKFEILKPSLNDIFIEKVGGLK